MTVSSQSTGLWPESRVLIIMTGGTICMRRSDDGFVPARGFLKAGLAPRPSFNDGTKSLLPLEAIVDDNGTKEELECLRTPSSSYNRQIRYCVHEFKELLDSSSLDSVGWTQIASTVFRNYRLFDGFVVLHGTDSLAYTCSALSFMLQNLGKPVILTGSQAPILELQNDATDNLLGSLIVAGHFMIPEVSAINFDAFASPNHPPLATTSATGTSVSWHLIHRPTSLKPLALQTNLDTAHVACLRIFPGIKPEMIEAVLNVKDLKGLVLETFGAGNAPGGPDSVMTRILGDAVKRGIVIVNVSQCLNGNVSPLYAPATILGRAGVVFGHDMTSEAALTKLSYLLGLPNASPQHVAKMMSTSLCGELTEIAKTYFHHPDMELLTPRLASLTKLGYAIAHGDATVAEEVIEGEKKWLLNDTDYAGNTPMHLAAVGPNLGILRSFLSQGASVHLRNRLNHTPIYLAAAVGNVDHVKLLREAGAHLHAHEKSMAEHLQLDANTDIWKLAGL